MFPYASFVDWEQLAPRALSAPCKYAHVDWTRVLANKPWTCKCLERGELQLDMKPLAAWQISMMVSYQWHATGRQLKWATDKRTTDAKLVKLRKDLIDTFGNPLKWLLYNIRT